MKSNIKIEEQEIRFANQLTGKEPVFDEKYPRCLVFTDVELPDGWSKNKTNLMLIKDQDQWIVFVDSDIEKAPVEFENLLSPYAREGWCELVINDVSSNKLDDIMDYLINRLGFVFSKKENAEATIKNLGIFRNMISYISNSKLKLVYEYFGPKTIISEEIYSFDNQIKKVLGVREIEEGWVFQEWDFTNSENKTVDDGFYFLKIRSVQDVGDMFQVTIVHKNIQGKENE